MLDGITYDIFSRPCFECGNHQIRGVMRTAGASHSTYRLSEEDYANVDQYIVELHQNFALDIVPRLESLRSLIGEYNSNGYFATEDLGAFRVRLIDKARVLLSRFSKAGILDRILEHAENEDDELVASFTLGFLATELHWLENHEDAIYEGYAHIDGREAGRPLAVAARRRQGRQTRKAVVQAALQLFSGNHSLRRNDSKTALAIAQMKLPDLKKRDGTFLGEEAIIKHLRAARCEGAFGKS